ncbi:hypothetical protein R3P38DRAFT_2921240 [Favolaschia claudopus]|uniref:Uncharacterized protein n=1 Tax=Favolaschia claudopus TaxID=2862362 RepID=A0AAW0C3D3_9AGAR
MARPLSAEASFTKGNDCPSAQAVAYLLANSKPDEFVKRLHSAVVPGSPGGLTEEQTQALLGIIQDAGAGNVAEARRAVIEAQGNLTRHCVRCHCAYLEKDNWAGACRIAAATYSDGSTGIGPKDCLPQCPMGTIVVKVDHFPSRHTSQQQPLMLSCNESCSESCQALNFQAVPHWTV